MPNQVIPLERVFQALSDPTRLAVVARLSRRGPMTVSALAEPFDMALPSFLQHLKLLEECGVIRSAKVGRTRICEIEPAQVHAAEAWLSQVRGLLEAGPVTYED